MWLMHRLECHFAKASLQHAVKHAAFQEAAAAGIPSFLLWLKGSLIVIVWFGCALAFVIPCSPSAVTSVFCQWGML